MRICFVASLFAGLFIQVGCVSMLTPTATPSRMRAYNDDIATRYVTANDLERDGKFEQARLIYQDLHQKHPKNPDYLHRLAVVNTQLKRYGEAANYYERAQVASPRNVRLLADMGYFFYIRGDLSHAEQTLKEAQRLKPNDQRVINNLALVKASQGKMQETEELLKGLGDEARALESLAYIYAVRGQSSLAESKYREALAINPELASAQKGLAELAKRAESEDFVPLENPSHEPLKLELSPEPFADDSPIQQVKAELEEPSNQVVNAVFEEPSFTGAEPGLLDDQSRETPSSPRAVTQAALFDDDAPEFDAPAEFDAPPQQIVAPESGNVDDRWDE